MKKDAQWVPVEVDELIAGWLADLPWCSRSVWVAVKCYVRAMGNGRGRCKEPSLPMFANMFGIPQANAAELVAAAIGAGALRAENGTWTIMDPEAVQSPDAARKRAAREAEECPDKPLQETAPVTSAPENAVVTDKPATSATEAERDGQSANVPDKAEMSGTTGKNADSLLRGEENRTEEKKHTLNAGGPEGASDPPEPDTGPPWENSEDRLLVEVGEAIMAVPKFAKGGYPPLHSLEKLLADNRRISPEDEAIRYELPAWVSFNLENPKKGGTSDGVRGLRTWFGFCHDKWRRARQSQARQGLLPMTAEQKARQAMEAIYAR